MRRVLLFAVLLALAPAAGAAAAVEPCSGPSTVGTIDQYCERIPTAGGPKPVAGGHVPLPRPSRGSAPSGGSTSSGPSTSSGGSAGKPSPSKASGGSHRKVAASAPASAAGGGAPPANGGSALSATGNAVGQSGGLLWILLGSGLLAAMLAAARLRRRSS